MVEHFHGKEGVAGSSPAPGSLAIAAVVIREGAGTGSEHPVDGELILGREHGSADLVIDDPGVSRRHARVLTDGAGVVVEDLGSSNGTYVMVDGHARELRLRRGEALLGERGWIGLGKSAAKHGDHVLRYRLERRSN